jgi:hypothetical protein
MDNDFGVHNPKQGNVSDNRVNNKKKLRVGVILDNSHLETWEGNMLDILPGQIMLPRTRNTYKTEQMHHQIL